jgi:predicted ATP-grasp superfamily ATP-dependent carboligase
MSHHNGTERFTGGCVENPTERLSVASRKTDSPTLNSKIHRDVALRSIAILESICGGGFESVAVQDIPIGLLQEGRAMLEAVASDFSRMEECKVEIAWDHRLGSWTSEPNQVNVVKVGCGDCRNTWTNLAERSDLALVIAPEIGNELANLLCSLRENCRTEFLNADEAFTSAASDKWLTAELFKAQGLIHPETKLVSSITDGDLLPASKTQRWVVKPRDGAGCEGLVILNSSADFVRWIAMRNEEGTCLERFIIQPWIQGRAGSIVVLAGEQDCILPPMTQEFSLATIPDHEALHYAGGFGPWYPIERERIEDFARSVIASLPGKPAGWIGIDFLIVEQDRELFPVVIEVNPRLTTSYIGLRSIVRENLAQLLINAKLGYPAKYGLQTNACEFRLDTKR